VEIEAAPGPARGDAPDEDAPGEDAPSAGAAPADGIPADTDAPELEVRSDRATAEGLASPAVRLLLEQASPFADELRAAQRELAGDGAGHDPAEALGAVGRAQAGLYGPQPALAPGPVPGAALATEPGAALATEPEATTFEADAVTAEFEAVPVEDAVLAPEPAAGADALAGPPAPGEALEARAAALPAAPALPTAARTAERRLVLSGLDSALAADIVGEAVLHGLPFGSPRAIKRLVRAALADRLRTLGRRGTGAACLAVAGPAGAGTTTVVAHLATAYARAAVLPVVVIALRCEDHGEELRSRLAGLDVDVQAAADGAQARRIAARSAGAMVLVDLPPVAVGAPSALAELAADVGALAPDELHLAMPATQSAAAADELAGHLDPLGLTHIALTRMDETQRPGAGLGFCLASGRPLSYLGARDGITPASAAAVAQLLLP
jgi:hypothetical protein